MEKTLSNKLSNEEYEALIAKTFEGTIVKEKTIYNKASTMPAYLMVFYLMRIF